MHQTDGVGLASFGVDGPGHGGSAHLFYEGLRRHELTSIVCAFYKYPLPPRKV